MKLSIIIAVLDSHEVFERQVLHFGKMELPEDVEVIFVDDGSFPALTLPKRFPNIKLLYTNDTRPWSQPCARNFGAEFAKGEFLFMTDIDHILSKTAILFSRAANVDKIVYSRYWAILDEYGEINQDAETLFEYGLDKKLYKERKLHAGSHANTFTIRKTVFEMLNGYDESFCGKYGGDDTDFSGRYSYLCRVEKKCKPHIHGGDIFVYPDPRRDVKGVFHKLRFK
jgi:predicted glycosyltransferase involved in capsule biosynthesis